MISFLDVRNELGGHNVIFTASPTVVAPLFLLQVSDEQIRRPQWTTPSALLKRRCAANKLARGGVLAERRGTDSMIDLGKCSIAGQRRQMLAKFHHRLQSYHTCRMLLFMRPVV